MFSWPLGLVIYTQKQHRPNWFQFACFKVLLDLTALYRHPKSIKARGSGKHGVPSGFGQSQLPSLRTPASGPGPPQIPLPHPGRILGPQAAHSAVARAELHLSVVLRRDPSGMKPAASAKTTASRPQFGISGQCFRFLSNQYERTLSDPVSTQDTSLLLKNNSRIADERPGYPYIFIDLACGSEASILYFIHLRTPSKVKKGRGWITLL